MFLSGIMEQAKHAKRQNAEHSEQFTISALVSGVNRYVDHLN